MKILTNKDLKKNYKRIVKNTIHAFGDTDLSKKVIRINKKKHKGKPGELLDTLVHEAAHVKHPKMKEKNIRKHTKRLVKKLNRKHKQSYYGLLS